MDNLLGILKITSMTTYGVNKKGTHYYMFKPTDKQNYVKHYVAFNLKNKTNKMYKNKGHDIYCIIGFLKNGSKYPYGYLKKIIGSVGDMQAEYEHVLFKYNLNYKTIKNGNISEANYKYNDLTHVNNIISIDPPDCKDIDDALHCVKLDDNNGYNISIHIADVSRYVQYGSPIDCHARNRLSTIYAPHKRIDMLSKELSTNICSLIEDCERYVVTISLCLKTDENKITDVQFKRTKIKNSKSYTYDQADKLLNKGDNHLVNLNDAANIIQSLFKFNVDLDGTHKLVQIYMILANMLAAQHLLTHNKYPLLRTHKSAEKNKECGVQDYMLKKHVKIVNMNRAIYEINVKDTSHSGLNVKYYTHFTSPIRRYSDIIVHRLLLEEDMDEHIICEELNNVNDRIKRADREFNKLAVTSKLNKGGEFDAYVTDIESKNVCIFVKKFNIAVYVKLFDDRLDDILEYKMDDAKLIIKNRQNGDMIQLILFDKIRVKMVPYIHENRFADKIKIRLLEPFLLLD